MSFLAKSPRLPSLAPSEAQQASSYREADAVPLGWGRDVFGSHWLSQPYNWREQSAGSSRPNWQYCSIVAGYMVGPIDFVGKVFVDGKEIVNFDYTFDVGEASHEFTINPSLALGQAWTVIVHRGSETDTVSANLVSSTGQDHPPYRGTAWAEWINIDLGGGVTSLPSLSLELGRATPDVGTYSAAVVHGYGVNPFAAIYALCLEQKGGLDLDADLLDATHWGDQATALEADGVGARAGNMVKCNPTWSQVKDAAAMLSELLAYADAFLYVDNGQLKVGWFPNAAPSGTLPEITEHDLDEKPSGGSFADWGQAATSAVVIFKDWERNYMEAPALCQVPANRETGYLSSPVRSDRPFIHTSDQAAVIAAEQSVSVAPDVAVNLSVLKSRAVKSGGAPLMPGDLLTWDYGPHTLDLVCRVVSRRMRSGQASDLLQVTRERGAFPTPYVPAVDDRVLPTPADPGEIDPAYVRLWWLPLTFALSLDAAAPRQVAALVDRADQGIIGALLSLSAAGAAPWEQVLDQRYFVAKCLATNGGINSSATTLRVTSASVDFARFEAQSALAQVDDTLLLLIEDELVSVSTIAVVSAGTYDLSLLRGRQGTTAAAHANGVAAWLFLRRELVAVTHNEFYLVRDGSNVYDVTTATKHFKIALFTIDETGDPKPDDPGLSLVFTDLAPQPPTGLSVTARTGFNEIRWTKSVTSTVETNFIYRNTVNDSGTATKIGENDGDFFADSSAVATTVYWYWVTAVDDGTESARTAAGTTTTLTAPLLGLLPSNPTAATKTDEGTRLGNDGTIYAWFEFSIPALPANAKWQNIEVKASTSTEYETKAQLTNTGTTDCIIENLIPGESYDVRTRAFSGAGPSAGVAVTSSPFTAPTDSTVPPAPGGLTVTARPGFNHVKWNASTDKDMVAGEYHVYRHTVDVGASATEIGVTKDLQFADPAPTPGTTQWYYVAPEDPSENLGAKTTGVSVVTAPDPVDDVTPSDPTAATKSGEGARQSTDGTTSAYFEMSIPALPANALYQNVEARVNVSGEYEIKAQLKNTSTAIVRIENLIPGQSYQVGVRAWSASRPSNFVAATSSPFTAPGDTTAPDGPFPTGPGSTWEILAGNDTAAHIQPRLRAGLQMFACRVKYGAGAHRDIFKYFLNTSSSSGTDPEVVFGSSGPEVTVLAGEQFLDFYKISQSGPLYLWCKPMDYSFNIGSWVLIGEIATTAKLQLPAGNLIEQNKNAVDLTGGQAILGGFEANVTTAVDARGVNVRVYDSGGTQRSRVNNATGDHYVNNLKVLGSQMTGWGAPTGTATRGAYATSTVTTEQLAERVKALIDDLGATGGHGLIDR